MENQAPIADPLQWVTEEEEDDYVDHLDAVDLDELITQLDQLKSEDGKINKALMKCRNVLEKCKSRLLSQENKDQDPLTS